MTCMRSPREDNHFVQISARSLVCDVTRFVVTVPIATGFGRFREKMAGTMVAFRPFIEFIVLA